MDHHSPSENARFQTVFLCKQVKLSPIRPQIAKKRGGSPSELRDFSDFGHSCPAVELDEFRHPSAETDRPSQVVGQRGERELGGDLLLPLAQEAADAVGVLDRAEGMYDWS